MKGQINQAQHKHRVESQAPITYQLRSGQAHLKHTRISQLFADNISILYIPSVPTNSGPRLLDTELNSPIGDTEASNQSYFSVCASYVQEKWVKYTVQMTTANLFVQS